MSFALQLVIVARQDNSCKTTGAAPAAGAVDAAGKAADVQNAAAAAAAHLFPFLNDHFPTAQTTFFRSVSFL